MTVEEFKQFCGTTEPGATLAFKYRDTDVQGRFVGCGEDVLVIEVEGLQYIWPREVCTVRKSDYPIPSYS